MKKKHVQLDMNKRREWRNKNGRTKENLLYDLYKVFAFTRLMSVDTKYVYVGSKKKVKRFTLEVIL